MLLQWLTASHFWLKVASPTINTIICVARWQGGARWCITASAQQASLGADPLGNHVLTDCVGNAFESAGFMRVRRVKQVPNLMKHGKQIPHDFSGLGSLQDAGFTQFQNLCYNTFDMHFSQNAVLTCCSSHWRGLSLKMPPTAAALTEASGMGWCNTFHSFTGKNLPFEKAVLHLTIGPVVGGIAICIAQNSYFRACIHRFCTQQECERPFCTLHASQIRHVTPGIFLLFLSIHSSSTCCWASQTAFSSSRAGHDSVFVYGDLTFFRHSRMYPAAMCGAGL